MVDSPKAPPPSSPSSSSSPSPSSSAEADAKLARRLRDAWTKTVGAYATEEGQPAGFFARLVEFGALSRDEAKKAVADTRHTIDENRKALDAKVEELVSRARSPLGDAREWKELEAEVARLEARVAALRDADQP